jgi:hypothetical protein
MSRTSRHCSPGTCSPVGNTWIVDLRHYLARAGALAELPSRTPLLAEYFAGIVMDATTNLDEPARLRSY